MTRSFFKSLFPLSDLAVIFLSFKMTHPQMKKIKRKKCARKFSIEVLFYGNSSLMGTQVLKSVTANTTVKNTLLKTIPQIIKVFIIWLWQRAVPIRKSCNFIGSYAVGYFLYCRLREGFKKTLLVSNKH